MKKVEDHPVEDVFGLEIGPDDKYYIFGKEVVSKSNLERYLIEVQQVECYQAI